MASIERRTYKSGLTRWRVLWYERGRKQQVTFMTEDEARRFKGMVEDSGNTTPPGWIRGLGFAEPINPQGMPVYDPAGPHIAELASKANAQAFNPRGWFVYLLYGDDPHQPIYIGKSTNVISRLGAHMEADDRRHLVQRVAVIRCHDDIAMNLAESELLRFYQPQLNKNGVGLRGIRPAS